MDDLRDRLLHTERGTPRGADAVWGAARRDLQRRRWARQGALVVTTVVLVAVVAVAAVRRDDAPTDRPVGPTAPQPTTSTTVLARVTQTRPWIATEIAPNSRSTWRRYLDPGTLRSAPPCVLDDLNVTTGVGGGLGSLYLYSLVQNRTSRVCSVRGAPYLELLDANGDSLGERTASATGTPLVLLPTSWARTDATSIGTSVCGSNLTFVSFGLDAATTRRVRVLREDGQGAARPCGTGSLGISRGARLRPLRSAFADGRFLDVYYRPLRDGTSLVAPREVRRGESLHFSITIAKNDAGRLVLDNSGRLFGSRGSCPLYRMAIEGVTTEPPLLLNCGTNGLAMVPGEAVRFEMRLAVPDDAPTGPATLRWQFVEPMEPALSVQVNIVG